MYGRVKSSMLMKGIKDLSGITPARFSVIMSIFVLTEARKKKHCGKQIYSPPTAN